MRIKDVKRQKKWVLCQIQVDNISEPTETQFDGFVQSLDVTFAQGSKDVMNYYFNDPIFAVDETLIGPQWYDIKWTGEYLKCRPAKSNQQAETDMEEGGIDWDKINLGKCRHGIILAFIKANVNIYDITDNPTVVKQIRKIAKFSMTGEIEE